MSAFEMSFDTTPWEHELEDMAGRTEAAVRPSAQAGAEVLYQAVRANVAKLGKVTGNLEKSIYQAFSSDQSAVGLAAYHVSWRAGGRRDAEGQLVRAGLAVAPHGHLLEYGYLQRYATYLDKHGRFRPVVRPAMRGKPPPKGGRNKQARDAYYVLLPTPKQIAAKPFIRPAVAQFAKAMEAAKDELFSRMGV